MAKFNGLKALFGPEGIRKYLDNKIEAADDKTLEILQYLGEEFVNRAREPKTGGNYQDRTGNLRSSVGYIILKDGELVDNNFELSEKGTERKPGLEQGKRFANQISARFPRGWVLIGVAGMEYAFYVESMKNYRVIEGTIPKRKDFIDLFSEIEL